METMSLLTCRVICRNCNTICDEKIALRDLSQAPCRYEAGGEKLGKAAVARTPIKDVSELNVGDHIVLGRCLYTHHAIVTETLISYSGKVQVIHFDGPNGDGQGKGVVKEERIQVTGDGTSPLYRVDYLPGACRPAAETVVIARMHLDTSNYDLLCNNCEHFATYCKTGLQDSSQVNAAVALLRRIAKRLLNDGTSSLTKNVVNLILQRRTIAAAAAAAAAAANLSYFELALHPGRWFRRRAVAPAPDLGVVHRLATKVGPAIKVAALAWEVWRFVEDVRDTAERRARGEPGGEASVMGEVLARRTCEVVCSVVGGVVGSLVPLRGSRYVGVFAGSIVGDSIGKMTGT